MSPKNPELVMQVTRIAPSTRLVPFVRDFTIVEASAPTTRTLIPDTGIIVGFRYGGYARQLEWAPDVDLPDATLAGMRRTARRMFTSAGGGVILANFRPGAAAAFFVEPFHELLDSTLALDDLAPASEVERATCRIAEAGSARERARRFEEFLLARLREEKRDPLVSAAVAAMHSVTRPPRVTELSVRLDISRDRFEKRFRQAVGTSPKHFASIVRLKNTIEKRRAGASFAEVALDAGYFDQSHFIREFRSVMGQSPRRFFEMDEHC